MNYPTFYTLIYFWIPELMFHALFHVSAMQFHPFITFATIEKSFVLRIDKIIVE